MRSRVYLAESMTFPLNSDLRNRCISILKERLPPAPAGRIYKLPTPQQNKTNATNPYEEAPPKSIPTPPQTRQSDGHIKFKPLAPCLVESASSYERSGFKWKKEELNEGASTQPERYLTWAKAKKTKFVQMMEENEEKYYLDKGGPSVKVLLNFGLLDAFS